MQKILVVADLKGMAHNKEVKRFLRNKIGANLRSAVSLGLNKDVSLKKAAADLELGLSQIAYFGACAFDLSPLLKVRANRGLAVVINNPRDYLLNAAPIALHTRGIKSSWPTALLIAVFAKWGVRAVFQMIIMSERPRNIQHLMLPSEWEEEIAAGLAKSDFSFHWTICSAGFQKAEGM